MHTVAKDLEISMKTQNIVIRKMFMKWTQQKNLTALILLLPHIIHFCRE